MKLIVGLLLLSLVLVGCSEQKANNPTLTVNSLEINPGKMIMHAEDMNYSWRISFYDGTKSCEPVTCLNTNNSLAYCIECPKEWLE